MVGWGHDIHNALEPRGYPKPGMTRSERFKLQLVVAGHSYIDARYLPSLPPEKSEIDASADYLFQVRMALRSQLQMSLGDDFSGLEREIQYYFTIPVIWKDAERQLLRAAITQAGYLRVWNDNRISYVTKTEAAMRYCLKVSVLNLHVKDIVLVAECGQGTVDLQAYEVASESRHSFTEFTPGSGDSCGLGFRFWLVLR